MALYFLILILVFFSIYVNVYEKSAYKQKNTLYEQKMSKFLTGSASDSYSGDNRWCASYILYTLNTNDNQNFSTKIYCENYGQKRYI